MHCLFGHNDKNDNHLFYMTQLRTFDHQFFRDPFPKGQHIGHLIINLYLFPKNLNWHNIFQPLPAFRREGPYTPGVQCWLVREL